MLIEIKTLEKSHPKARGSRKQVCVLKCDVCSTIFERNLGYRNQDKHHCSRDCSAITAGLTNRKRITKPCSDCDMPVTKSQCWEKNSVHWFCDQRCYGNWRSKQDFMHEALKNLQTPEVRKKAMATRGAKWVSGELKHPRKDKKHSEETKAFISQHHLETGCLKGEKNGMFNRKHTDAAKDVMSDKKSQALVDGRFKPYGNNSRKGTYTEAVKTTKIAHYRSSWELAMMKWLDANSDVVSWESEPVRLPYYYLEHLRWYVPDFIVAYSDGSRRMFEIKPKEFVETQKNQLKAEAGHKYCHENQITEYKIMTGDDLRSLAII